MLPSEKWLARGSKKLLPPVPEQRFGHFTLDYTDTRPRYPDLIMLGTPKGPADFIYLHSTSRGAKDFESRLGHFQECHRNKLDVLVRLYAITRDKYEDRIPVLRALYHFGLSNTSAWVYESVLDDAVNRAAADDVGAFLAEDGGAISNFTAKIVEAIYAVMLHAEIPIFGTPRIPNPFSAQRDCA
jgi:hypothetical protein